jgi:hypothetical protein
VRYTCLNFHPTTAVSRVEVQVQQLVSANRLNGNTLIHEIGENVVFIEQSFRKAEHKPQAVPVGQVKAGIAVILQHLCGIMAEVALMVGDHCMAGADFDMAEKIINGCLLFGSQHPVNRLQFVVLVFAHGCF